MSDLRRDRTNTTKDPNSNDDATAKISASRTRSQQDTAGAVDRQLKEREIVNLFMAVGLYENIARSIIKNNPEISTLLTESLVDPYKTVLREALSTLEREGVPNIHIEKEQTGTDGTQTRTMRVALCQICKDAPTIKAQYPTKMRKYFRRTQGYNGRLTKDHWLCRTCYADWYKEHKEWLKDVEEGRVQDEEDTPQPEDAEGEDKKSEVKKEYYIKTRALLLLLIVKFLVPKALPHRKMLVRYVALNQIQVAQLPTALFYLRKLGNGIIDVEDFEKAVGIGRWADLFGYSSWNAHATVVEILKTNEAERQKRKQEKLQKRLEAEKEIKEKEEEEKYEQQRQQQLQEILEKAEKEAAEKARADKWTKLAEQRKQEDEKEQEERKKQQQQREKQQEKREQDKIKNRRAREQELRDAENAIKAKEEEIKKRKEERYRQERLLMTQRNNELKLKNLN